MSADALAVGAQIGGNVQGRRGGEEGEQSLDVTFDDTDDGLYGLNARGTYTAEASGTHRLRIYSKDFTKTFTRFSVSSCDEVDCNA